MQNILRSCEDRVVLFDNRTNDRIKEAKQADQLLSLVNMVVNVNGGLPYSDEILKQAKVKYILIYPKKLPVDNKLCYSQCKYCSSGNGSFETAQWKRDSGNRADPSEL